MAVDVPVSIWQSTDGLSDFSNTGANNIVDTLGNYLVDPSGNFIVDTGVIQFRIPATEWEQDDSV